MCTLLRFIFLLMFLFTHVKKKLYKESEGLSDFIKKQKQTNKTKKNSSVRF